MDFYVYAFDRPMKLTGGHLRDSAEICYNLRYLLGHLRHFEAFRILYTLLESLRHILENFGGQLMDFYKHLIDI